MTQQQQLILEAVDLLVATNNKFIEYYDTLVPIAFNPNALHPAEECAIAFLTARMHLRRIASDNALNINPLLKAFKLCKTTEMNGT
jgi:hypothetical protein